MKREKAGAWGGGTGSDRASQAEGADIISERQASRRGHESNERQRVEDKTTEGKQLLMFFKNNLTFTCFPRAQPGQSSAKGQQPSACAAGTPHVCRGRAIFIGARKKNKHPSLHNVMRRSMQEREQLLFVRGRWEKIHSQSSSFLI